MWKKCRVTFMALYHGCILDYFISLHYLRNILAVAMKGKDSGMDEGAQIVMLLSA